MTFRIRKAQYNHAQIYYLNKNIERRRSRYELYIILNKYYHICREVKADRKSNEIKRHTHVRQHFDKT